MHNVALVSPVDQTSKTGDRLKAPEKSESGQEESTNFESLYNEVAAQDDQKAEAAAKEGADAERTGSGETARDPGGQDDAASASDELVAEEAVTGEELDPEADLLLPDTADDTMAPPVAKAPEAKVEAATDQNAETKTAQPAVRSPDAALGQTGLPERRDAATLPDTQQQTNTPAPISETAAVVKNLLADSGPKPAKNDKAAATEGASPDLKPTEDIAVAKGEKLPAEPQAETDAKPRSDLVQQYLRPDTPRHTPPRLAERRVAQTQPVSAPASAEAPKQPQPQVTTQPQISTMTHVQDVSGPKLTALDASPEVHSFELRGSSSSTSSGFQLQRAEMPRSVMTQLIDVARAAKDKPVSVSLNPQELGRVRMAVSTHDNVVTLHIVAEKPETLDLMRRHIAEINREMADAGFDQLDLSFGEGQLANAEQEAADDRGDSGPHRELVADEMTSQPEATVPPVAAPTVEGRLDIRV